MSQRSAQPLSPTFSMRTGWLRALRPAGLALLALVTCTFALRADEPPKKKVEFTTTELGDGLHRIHGTAAGGVLVLVGKRGLLLVDAGDAPSSKAFDKALRGISRLPVKTIINTHYHADHLGANPLYAKKGATIVAHENVPAQALKDTVVADWGDWHRKPSPEDAMPGVTLGDTLRMDFEGEPVEIYHAPAAHTDGDLVVWFPGRNVLHTGDIVEVGAPLFIDLWAGGSIGGMTTAVQHMLRLANGETRIVPGHGDVVGVEYLRRYRKMLGYFSSIALESINGGRDLKPFLDLEQGKEWSDMVGGPRGVRQVSALMFYALNDMQSENKYAKQEREAAGETDE